MKLVYLGDIIDFLLRDHSQALRVPAVRIQQRNLEHLAAAAAPDDLVADVALAVHCDRLALVTTAAPKSRWALSPLRPASRRHCAACSAAAAAAAAVLAIAAACAVRQHRTGRRT